MNHNILEVNRFVKPFGMDPMDVQRVIHIQRIVRGRIARRNGQHLAVQAYRKCTDESSGMAYYCNLLTGSVGWDKPLLLGSADAEWYDPALPVEQEPTANAAAVKPPVVIIPAVVPSASVAELLQKREQSATFQRQCALEREQLMKKHHRKIARAIQKWDQKVLLEKQERRATRLAQLKAENQAMAQELFEGKRVS